MTGDRSCQRFGVLLTLGIAVLFTAAAWSPALAQTGIVADRFRGHGMLRAIEPDIRKHYYDATFRGRDLEAHFKAAHEKVEKASTTGEIFGIVAQTLTDFGDSHLRFIPPMLASSTEYGWRWAAIGDECYVTAVKPGSDAEAKGVSPGDRIVSINGFKPTRDTLWKVDYIFRALVPQPGLRVVLQSPGREARQLDVMAKVARRKRVLDINSDGDFWTLVREAEGEMRLHRDRQTMEGDTMVWRMVDFLKDDPEIDAAMRKARGKGALILDLRGNGGGYVAALQRLTGWMFDHDVSIADVRERTSNEPLIAKTRGKSAFTGKLVVLVDAGSASASELFARVVQLEGRGTVIGDRTAGAVMRSKRISYKLGADAPIFYGASITNADVIMRDGTSIERVGVTPDLLLLPSAEDLASERDPVLARAAQLTGAELDASRAGALFPITWR